MPNTIIFVDIQKAFITLGGTLFCGDENRRNTSRRFWEPKSYHD